MPTTSPEAALIKALVAYLQTSITTALNPTTGLPDLAQSTVVEEWPEPTVDLQLAHNRVVVAVIRAGRSSGDKRLGGPLVEKVTPGVSPTGTVRYEYGQIDQPLTIGLWANRRELRNDVDLLLGELLNRPMWSTISPVAATTLSTAITTTGEQLVVPASMVDIWPGITVDIDTGANLERVYVKDIRPTGFIASVRKKHSAGVAIAEVAGRRETAAAGLHLRATDHFSNLAQYLFDDGAQTLDDVEGGRGSQRQEWRSLRNGVGSLRWSREVTGVVLQKRLFEQVHASTTGGEVANPIVKQVF